MQEIEAKRQRLNESKEEITYEQPIYKYVCMYVYKFKYIHIYN